MVAAFAFYVLETEPRWYERLRYPLEYEEIVVGHAENYDLEPHLVAAVIYQESKFDADAVSASGAVGLMQLLPATAQGIADRTGGTGWHERDLVNPELNVRYGSWYLRHLLDKYQDEELALAAYNAGQANVDRWRKQGERDRVSRDAALRRAGGGAEGGSTPRVPLRARALATEACRSRARARDRDARRPARRAPTPTRRSAAASVPAPARRRRSCR